MAILDGDVFQKIHTRSPLPDLTAEMEAGNLSFFIGCSMLNKNFQ